MQSQDLITFIEKTGAGLNRAIAGIGFATKTLLGALNILFIGRSRAQPMRLRHLISEINIAGVQALPVVILMSAMIGVMLAIQGIYSLRVFGAETQVTFGLALSIPREFAPLITGILVAGRSGLRLACQYLLRWQILRPLARLAFTSMPRLALGHRPIGPIY